MHTEDTTPYYCCSGQKFESLSDSLEKLYAKFLFTLIIKAIDLVEVTALMVASKKKEIEWVFDFQGH